MVTSKMASSLSSRRGLAVTALFIALCAFAPSARAQSLGGSTFRVVQTGATASSRTYRVELEMAFRRSSPTLNLGNANVGDSFNSTFLARISHAGLTVSQTQLKFTVTRIDAGADLVIGRLNVLQAFSMPLAQHPFDLQASDCCRDERLREGNAATGVSFQTTVALDQPSPPAVPLLPRLYAAAGQQWVIPQWPVSAPSAGQLMGWRIAYGAESLLEQFVPVGTAACASGCPQCSGDRPSTGVCMDMLAMSLSGATFWTPQQPGLYALWLVAQEKRVSNDAYVEAGPPTHLDTTILVAPTCAAGDGACNQPPAFVTPPPATRSLPALEAMELPITVTDPALHSTFELLLTSLPVGFTLEAPADPTLVPATWTLRYTPTTLEVGRSELICFQALDGLGLGTLGLPCTTFTVTAPTPVDCVVGPWSDFDACTAACGGGTQTRVRDVLVSPMYGGAVCPPLSETLACNALPCPVDCVVGDWTDYGPCSAACGGGTTTRTRPVLTAPLHGGTDCPATSESLACNEQPCPVDCVVSPWSDFDACTAACGGGTWTRERSVETPPAYGGLDCPALSETLACNEQPCPVDCVVGDWTDYGPCSAACGGGTTTRTRPVLTEPLHGGMDCPTTSESLACNEEACAELDAGVDVDAGVEGDASVEVDASVDDASVDDASISMDASVESDAGDAGDDAALEGDADVVDDGGLAPSDAASGCGCSTAGRPAPNASPLALVSLGLLLALGARRRPRASKQA